MCKFFSFVTEPEGHPNERFYFNWEKRKKNFDGADSHDHIISHYKLPDSKCNSYEYNPLTKVFDVDQQNSGTDDRVQAERWVEGLDWKRIVKPLIIKPIINPFTDCKKVKKPTKAQIELLREWDSAWDSVGVSVWNSVGDSVVDSVRAYCSSFFDIKYAYDFSSCVELWEQGLVPSYDGKTWRLRSGKKAEVVYEISKDELGK